MPLSIEVSANNRINEEEPVGHWQMDACDMPRFHYTGALPYQVVLENGEPARIHDDPYFLLGNYRFKLFAHISGEYEIMTTERVIARFNSKQQSAAEIAIDGETIRLTGTGSVAGDPGRTYREFGAGHARYTYDLGRVEAERTFSVLPSSAINQGESGFLITVALRNRSGRKVEVSYQESLEAGYERVTNRGPSPKDLTYRFRFDQEGNRTAVGRTSIGDRADLFPSPGRNDFSTREYYPPVLFFRIAGNEAAVLGLDGTRVRGTYTNVLDPGEEVVVRLVIGYTLNGDPSEIEDISESLLSNDPARIMERWSQRVGHFEGEPDQELRRELIWHNSVLESMASYSEFFDETFIPQGCMYLFSWGIRAAPRDHLQHALAACYTNPELARSILRYVMKKSSVNGYIPFMDMGHGYLTSKYYLTSDQQLYFFMALSEYLRITGDYEFLLEEIPYYPVRNAGSSTVARRVSEYYHYLREEVGRGPRGLVRLMNSDWNDLVFYSMETIYNKSFNTNESLMNTTMAAAILPGMSEQLARAAATPELSGLSNDLVILSESMSQYGRSIWQSFLDDHGGRSFARRMYFNGKPVGEENMFLEPQGYLMQVEGYPDERKESLYREIRHRLLDSEKTGARQEEKMELSEAHFGSRENGGIWYALNGPLVIGLSTWNREAAWELFLRLTLQNQAAQFPKYWSCYWSSFDSVDSSILPSEGLHGQEERFAVDHKMTYCAHLHAWLIYCYRYMKEGT